MPGGPTAAIVVLDRVSSMPASARLSLAPAAALANTLLRPQDALFTTDWFGLGTLAPREVAARCNALAAQIPVIEATWPDHAALPSLAGLVAARTGLLRPHGTR